MFAYSLSPLLLPPHSPSLWQRRFGTPPKDDREKARQVRFLMARGYAMSVALKVVRIAASDDGLAEGSI